MTIVPRQKIEPMPSFCFVVMWRPGRRRMGRSMIVRSVAMSRAVAACRTETATRVEHLDTVA